MSKKAISPLRQRMIDDMTARRFKEKVQKDDFREVHEISSAFKVEGERYPADIIRLSGR